MRISNKNTEKEKMEKERNDRMYVLTVRVFVIKVVCLTWHVVTDKTGYTLVIAEARALKNVKQFLQNPHDVYRIEGFLAATKKDLILK